MVDPPLMATLTLFIRLLIVIVKLILYLSKVRFQILMSTSLENRLRENDPFSSLAFRMRTRLLIL